MTALEEKIDIMARILLGETDAKSELKSLLEKSRKRSRTELIHEAMKELGVPYGNYGHDYLVEAVGMVIDNHNLIHNATRAHGLYQVLAKKGKQHSQPGRACHPPFRRIYVGSWRHRCSSPSFWQHHRPEQVQTNQHGSDCVHCINCPLSDGARRIMYAKDPTVRRQVHPGRSAERNRIPLRLGGF